MKYSPERRGTVKEITVLHPYHVREKRSTKKIKGWVNFRLSRQVTWSFNYSTGDERIWLNAAQDYHVYADLESNDLKHLLYNIVLILQFRSQIGTKKAPFVARKNIRIPKKEFNNAKRQFAKFYRVKTMRRNKVLKSDAA